jgi:PAS domain S-box-containing protein
MNQYSIRQYVAWLTLTPLLIITVSLELFFLQDNFFGLDRNLLERGQLIARQLASSSEYGVFANNQPFLQNIAQGVLQQPDVQGVIILDGDSRVLIDAGEFFGVPKNVAGDEGTAIPDTGISADRQSSAARVDKIRSTVNPQTPIYRSSQSLRIYHPIYPAQVVLDELDGRRDAEQIGAVIVEMSRLHTEQHKSQMLWLTVGFTALFLMFPFGLIYLGSRKITYPIRKLSDVVQRLGEGRFEARVAVSAAVTELDILVRGINNMAEKLHQEQLKLQQETARLIEAQRIAHLGNWEWDVANNTMGCSDEIFRIFGLAPQQLVATYDVFMQAVHPEDRQAVESKVREALERGYSYSLDHRILLPDGTVRFVHEQAEISRNEDGLAVKMQGTMQDITEDKRIELEAQQRMLELTHVNAELHELNARLKQTQSQLMQSEKMASIGILAAGVAHEINNPIGYIQSNLGVLADYVASLLAVLDAYEKAKLALSDRREQFAGVSELERDADLAYLKRDVVALLGESQEGVDRVKQIVRNLKDFSRIDTEEKWMQEDIHHGLDSTLSVIWNELKYKCEVVKEYGELPLVECLLPQLNQVFMNLLVNAAQAIEIKGRITIRTGTRNDQVWIEIADSGKGIPPENLNRIFDPFFTTKPVGEGTGLGLSVSFSIIQKHHGKFEVESTPGKGAVFRVILPIKQPASVAADI